MLLLVTTICLAITSCGGGNDEPDNPYIPETPNPPNNPDDSSEDAQKYDIVGIWETDYKWSYSTEHITLDIKTNGTFSASSTYDNGNSPWYGTGTWTYNARSWHLSTGDSMISGTYVIINNQLINHQDFADGSSRTVTYVRKDGSGNQTQIRSSDFIGKWYHSSGDYVFNFKDNGIGDIYVLKSWKGSVYTKKEVCTWEYVESSMAIKVLSSLGKIEENIINTNFPKDFTTSDGKWTICSSLPKSDDGNNESGDDADSEYSNHYIEYHGSGKKCCEIELSNLVMGTEIFAGGGNSHIKYLRLFDKDGKGIFSLEKHYDGATIPSNDKWDSGTYKITDTTPNLFNHDPIIISRPHKAIQNELGVLVIKYVGNQIILDFKGTHSSNEYENVKVYFKGYYSN